MTTVAKDNKGGVMASSKDIWQDKATSVEEALDQAARLFGGISGRGSDGSVRFCNQPGWWQAERMMGNGFAEAPSLPTIKLLDVYRIVPA